jgi:hypothetical protein
LAVSGVMHVPKVAVTMEPLVSVMALPTAAIAVLGSRVSEVSSGFVGMAETADGMVVCNSLPGLPATVKSPPVVSVQTAVATAAVVSPLNPDGNVTPEIPAIV